MKDLITPIFNATVEKGNTNVSLSFTNPKVLEQYLLNLFGKELEVIIRQKRKLRSIPQNKYYWGVIVAMVSHETGQSNDDIHAYLKYRFAPKKKSSFKGRLQKIDVIRPKSTTELTTGEFEQYNADCRAWASDFFGLMIPLPNEAEI